MLSGPQVTPLVKEEVGFSQLDCPYEDFHGTCHLSNPGDQVSGLPPSLPPTGVGYCSQMCAHHSPVSPLGRDHSLALCCYQSAGLVLRGAGHADPPSWALVQVTGELLNFLGDPYWIPGFVPFPQASPRWPCPSVVQDIAFPKQRVSVPYPGP